MNTTFPFGFESPVTFYMLTYVLTWVLHAIFMAYVLAGSIVVAWATVFPGRADPPRSQRPLTAVLREWMPLMLSGAITAAVAPLLFVQVIYRQQFYTANLLLGWRWLMVIPVLIAAFYLLYLLKSRAVETWAWPVRCATAVSAASCFLFVAFCWTTNHLLGLDQAHWAQSYATRTVVSSVPLLALRLLTWVAGVFPVMGLLVAWQLASTKPREDSDAAHHQTETRTLSRLSLAGLIVAAVSGLTCGTQLPHAVQSHLVGAAGRTWIIVTACGVALQMAGWLHLCRQTRLCRRTLSVLSLGSVTTLTGTACLREIIRVSQSDPGTLTENCRAAAGVGGFGLFVVCLVLNLILMGVCLVVTVRHADQAAADTPSA